jgi:hypothetical protein
MSRKRSKRKAAALAAADRKGWITVGAGAVLGLALFAIALSIVPTASPKHMVRAQAVRGTTIGPAAATNPPGAANQRPAEPATADRAPQWETVPAPVAASAAQGPAGYRSIGFEKLSAFPFDVTYQMLDDKKDARNASADTLRQIPNEVKALNDHKVSVKGFMLPTTLEHGRATEFLILRNQSMCCYGIPPRITEWVNVRTAGKGIKPIMDQPVTVCGTFHVGDVRENGELVGIYRLDAEKLTPDYIQP